MFTLFKKLNTEIVSPVNGQLISLSQVKDPVFSEKMMGDGVAFIVSDDVVCSPCNGVVVMIATTNHAIGLRNNEGIEILLHIGLDTVNFQGNGFTCLVKKDSKVTKGQPLIKFDKTFFETQKADLTTPLIITDTNGFIFDIPSINSSVQTGKAIITYKKS